MRDLLVILTPIAVLLLVVRGGVGLQKLRRNRGWALLLAFVISAIVEPPPDAYSMSITALSMYLLFEVSLLCVGLLRKG